MPLFSPISHPSTPGLFVTGTDTHVGKTVVACLIADQLRRRSQAESPRSRVGVFKPIATGCRRDREGLVSDDAEQLATAADFDPDIGDLSVVNPVALRPALAPAAALAQASAGARLDVDAIARALARLDARCDAIIAEGVGGVMVPLAPFEGASPASGPFETTLDLMRAIGYPVVVVCRAGLGTLNHTAMTCRLVREAGLTIAGLVVNGYDADAPDESMQTNRAYLAAQNRAPVLATLPVWSDARDAGGTPAGARRPRPVWNARSIDPTLREAMDTMDFRAICRPGRSPRR